MRAVSKIGLDVAGIDIVCQDIAVPLIEQGGAVIEVNAAPGIRMHQHPSKGEARDAGEAIIDGLMGSSNGRIPVVAVTGTNGKTTTTLMIGHTARVAGLGTGVTTTEGVFVDGRRLVQGDCTGYWSARTVLTAPDVDFAVLETARGGILKRGLAFDYCDVGVVLNVSPDHLGLDGIDTIEDLAQVKAVVAQSAARAVVLNAEDALCVSMVRRAKPGAEVIFFSMNPDNPILLKHLEDGGRGTYVQDNAIVIADGTRQQELMRVEAMPASYNGLARYNIANALAAAAALMAAGFSNVQIADGLSTFVSDSKTNPLRTNVFDVRGVTVIVDYAHNPAAYAALAEMARAAAGSTGRHRHRAWRPPRQRFDPGGRNLRRALRRAGGLRVAEPWPADGRRGRPDPGRGGERRRTVGYAAPRDRGRQGNPPRPVAVQPGRRAGICMRYLAANLHRRAARGRSGERGEDRGADGVSQSHFEIQPRQVRGFLFLVGWAPRAHAVTGSAPPHGSVPRRTGAHPTVARADAHTAGPRGVGTPPYRCGADAHMVIPRGVKTPPCGAPPLLARA
ncbi:Mur ligase family protein [Massilia sp. Dwa41.01b]|uniref:Mur ligase family protein n=1 Tax=Massilia sp. Dwa41.01b TaxID=2709302 RepID=UPI001E4FACD3|nr:Mur ligase family protein [Massilia sp. Dwa41.01b]